ncbi:hypothetical protein [Vibrio harveyi]
MVDVIRSHTKLNKEQAKDKAIEMLRIVGIPSPQKCIEKYPHQLSGGMCRRVMIAMALPATYHYYCSPMNRFRRWIYKCKLRF